MQEFRMKNYFARPKFFVLPLISFLIIFFYLPLFGLLLNSLTSFSFELYSKVFDELFWQFLSFSLSQSLFSVFFCLLLGIPTAFALSNGKPYFSRLLSVLVFIPFLMPPLSILLGLVIIYEPGGLFTQWFGFSPIQVFGSPQGIILAHTLYNISLVTRIVESSFRTRNRSFFDVADVFGANSWQKFRTITLPHILPSIFSASLLVFLLSFNSFAVVALLGSVKFQTIEVLIFSVTRIRLDYVSGSILAIFQLAVNALIVLVYLRFTKHDEVVKSDFESQHIPSRIKRMCATSWILLIIAFTWQSIFATGYHLLRLLNQTSILDLGRLFSLSYDPVLGTSSLRVIFNTIFFGLVTGLIAVGFSISLLMVLINSKERVNESLLSFATILPLATSSITISFGIFLVFGSLNWFSQFIWVFILSAHITASLPFIIRTTLVGWHYVSQELILVGKTLGASSGRIFAKIVFPLIKGYIFVGFTFSLAVSFGEFGATNFLARGEWSTVSIAIGRLFSTHSTLLPTFFAIFLIGLTFVVFLFVEKVEVKI